MESRYKALDIAKYIVQYSNKEKYEISNLRLQKLLYFVQGQFILEKSKFCFEDELEAWKYGPVVPSVYSFYKYYGNFSIEERPEYAIDWQTGKIQDVYFDDNKIREEDKSIINTIVKNAQEYSVNQLVNITHQQSPWKVAVKTGLNSVITKESLKDFFNQVNDGEK